MTGTWVGQGSAARNTTRTSRKEYIRSGCLSRFGLVYTFSGSELLRKQI